MCAVGLRLVIFSSIVGYVLPRYEAKGVRVHRRVFAAADSHQLSAESEFESVSPNALNTETSLLKGFIFVIAACQHVCNHTQTTPPQYTQTYKSPYEENNTTIPHITLRARHRQPVEIQRVNNRTGYAGLSRQSFTEPWRPRGRLAEPLHRQIHVSSNNENVRRRRQERNTKQTTKE